MDMLAGIKGCCCGCLLLSMLFEGGADANSFNPFNSPLEEKEGCGCHEVKVVHVVQRCRCCLIMRGADAI